MFSLLTDSGGRGALGNGKTGLELERGVLPSVCPENISDQRLAGVQG